MLKKEINKPMRKLASVRALRNISQDDLVVLLKNQGFDYCKRDIVSRLEQGKSVPSYPLMLALAKALNTTVEAISEWE